MPPFVQTASGSAAVDALCNCLNPVPSAYSLGATTLPAIAPVLANPGNAMDYTVAYQLNFQPWTGGTVVNNNAITGAYGGQVIWDYTLTGGTSIVSGTFEIRSRATGQCVWCDSFTGTATINAAIRGPQLSPGYQDGSGSAQITFSGETLSAPVPEPGSAALASIAGLAAATAQYIRKRKRDSAN
jgi:hypothetical protein